MYFLNTVTGEYPRHQGDLELLGWSVGEPLPQNWVEVAPVERPDCEESQKAIEIAPVLLDGVWTQRWEVVDITAEELARIEELRAEMRRPLSIPSPQ